MTSRPVDDPAVEPVSPGSGHARAYRAMVRLYPASFRDRFGDEMVRLFADQLRDAQAKSGAVGTVRTWLRTLWDVAITAPSERWRDRTVAHSLSSPPTDLNRTLGLLGILGGAILLVAFLPIELITPALNPIRLVLFNLGAMAIIVAVHRRQVSVSRQLAWLGAIPAFAANGWYATMVILAIGRDWGTAGDYGYIWFLAGLTMWIADAWFGLVALRLGVGSRWGAIALVVGSLAIIGMDRFELVHGLQVSVFSILALTGVALNGLGWILFGLDIATHRRPRAPQPG